MTEGCWTAGYGQVQIETQTVAEAICGRLMPVGEQKVCFSVSRELIGNASGRNLMTWDDGMSLPSTDSRLRSRGLRPIGAASCLRISGQAGGSWIDTYLADALLSCSWSQTWMSSLHTPTPQNLLCHGRELCRSPPSVVLCRATPT